MTCPNSPPRVQCPNQRRAERAERFARAWKAGAKRYRSMTGSSTKNFLRLCIMVSKRNRSLRRAHATLRRQGERLVKARRAATVQAAGRAWTGADVYELFWARHNETASLRAEVERLRGADEEAQGRFDALVACEAENDLLRQALPIVRAAEKWRKAEAGSDADLDDVLDAAPPALLELARSETDFGSGGGNPACGSASTSPPPSATNSEPHQSERMDSDANGQQSEPTVAESVRADGRQCGSCVFYYRARYGSDAWCGARDRRISAAECPDYEPKPEGEAE